MPSSFSNAASTFLSKLRANSGILAIAIALITLVVAVRAASVALEQLRDAKRAVALNAVATAVSLYSAPKARYYDALLTHADRLKEAADPQSTLCSPVSSHTEFLIGLNLRDYLHGIEVACSIYIGGLLDEEQKCLVAGYVKGDIDLLLYSYEEDSGSVGNFLECASPVKINWITPEGKSADPLQPYSATRACLKEWRIELERNEFP